MPKMNWDKARMSEIIHLRGQERISDLSANEALGYDNESDSRQATQLIDRYDVIALIHSNNPKPHKHIPEDIILQLEQLLIKDARQKAIEICDSKRNTTWIFFRKWWRRRILKIISKDYEPTGLHQYANKSVERYAAPRRVCAPHR